MSDFETIGESSVLMKAIKFEWRIHKFSYLLCLQKPSVYKSHKFHLLDSTWFLTVAPNYTESFDRYVSLSLHRDSSIYAATADISFSIKTINHISVNEKKCTHIFNEEKPVWSCRKFLDESELFRRKLELMPSDTLTILCSIEISNTSFLQARYYQLSEDLKKLYNSKENADIVLNVKGKTYLAHRSILGARSSVLAAMFKNDMNEKKTGIVNISDCDPEAFKAFLLFLYSGSVDFTQCNVCDLYKITDKYDVSELKLMCTDVMIKNLSVKNFCDILVLCDHFNDAKLFMEVQRYFHENSGKVVSSENWQFLIQNNFRPANNLLKQMSSKVKIV